MRPRIEGLESRALLTTLLGLDLPTAMSVAPVAFNNALYYPMNDALSGEELWKTDGTPGGTSRVADINPGALGSAPRNFTVVGSTLYFTGPLRRVGRNSGRPMAPRPARYK